MNHLRDHLEKVPSFVKVVEAGSIKSAAQLLHIAQPSLSVTIRILEEAIGKPLLNRSRFGVTPTNEGQVLYNYGKQLEQETQLTERRISNLSNNLEGTLRICTHELLVGTFWGDVLRRTKKIAKNLELELITFPNVTKVIHSLKHWQADLAVTLRPQSYKELEAKMAYTESYGFYATNSYIKKHKIAGSLSAKEIASHPLIYLEKSIAGLNNTLIDELQKNELSEGSAFKVSTAESAIALSLSDLGIVVLPKVASCLYLEKKLLHEVKIKGYTRNLGNHDVFVFNRQSQRENKKEALVRKLIIESCLNKKKTLV